MGGGGKGGERGGFNDSTKTIQSSSSVWRHLMLQRWLMKDKKKLLTTESRAMPMIFKAKMKRKKNVCIFVTRSRNFSVKLGFDVK